VGGQGKQAKGVALALNFVPNQKETMVSALTLHHT
jgi:hypothetical protein